MEAGQGNNKEHFVETFYQNRLRYRNFALRFVHNETDAEQIVDDCFLRFFERRNQIEDRNIESYFYTSLKYGCLNHLRDQQRHYEFKKEIYDKTYRLRQYDITILDSLDSAQIFSREIHYILQRELQRMAKLRREVFLDSRFDDLNYDQIADKYAISKIKVKREVRAAVQLLREALMDYLPILIILLLFSNFV